MQSKDKGKGAKGNVSIYVEKGRIKANLPRQYFGGKQVRIALGMDASPENMARAERIAARITMDLQDDCFDSTLEKYGIKQHLKLVQASLVCDDTTPKQEMSILEVWSSYCEYRKNDLAATTYHNTYKKFYASCLEQAIEQVGENAIAIRGWLLANRRSDTTKDLLSLLSKAYKLLIKQRTVSCDPFDGLSDNIERVKKKVKEIDQTEDADDDDVLDTTKAFTWDEANEILSYLKNKKQVSHWYDFIKFKFLTGCRTGEAIALWWKDIKWDDEFIWINRSYDYRLKIFKPTKNETARQFPMQKGGELWELLKSIPQGQPNECVFKSKTGGIIHSMALYNMWGGRKDKGSKGCISTLIEQGKVSKYLPPYNTRHTFINHQINDVGIPPHVVNSWCEHSDQVSRVHYRQLDLKVIPGYGEKREIEKSEAELLREQIEMLTKRLDELDK